MAVLASVCDPATGADCSHPKQCMWFLSEVSCCAPLKICVSLFLKEAASSCTKQIEPGRIQYPVDFQNETLLYRLSHQNSQNLRDLITRGKSRKNKEKSTKATKYDHVNKMGQSKCSASETLRWRKTEENCCSWKSVKSLDMQYSSKKNNFDVCSSDYILDVIHTY